MESSDIEMTTDDTLELDAIIKEWSTPTSTITVNPQGTLSSDSHSLNGFETKTGVFDPDKAGEYKIKINGQTLKISVKDTSTNNLIDDFESQDLSDYTYVSASGNFSFSSDPVINGNFSLVGNHNISNPRMVSTSGLNYYPSRGDTVAWYFRPGNVSAVGCGVILLLDGTSEEKGYTFEIGRKGNKPNNNEMQIRKYTSEGTINLDNAPASLSDDTWYEVEVVLGTDGSLDMSVYNVDSVGDRKNKISTLKTSDSDYASGGIGISLSVSGSSNSTSYFDYLRTI